MPSSPEGYPSTVSYTREKGCPGAYATHRPAELRQALPQPIPCLELIHRVLETVILGVDHIAQRNRHMAVRPEIQQRHSGFSPVITISPAAFDYPHHRGADAPRCRLSADGMLPSLTA